MMNLWNQITFANPWAFTLLVIPLLLAARFLVQGRKLYPTLVMPDLRGLEGFRASWRGRFKQNLWVLRVLALILLIAALARPQIRFSEEDINTEGIDIVMALDVSGSMLAQDFRPDRLGAAKEKAAAFIEGRPSDRIGLVVFAGESFTQCPLTTDHNIALKLLSEIKNGLIEDGTAIGMGLATSVIRLKDSETKSKVVILLTDGVNNSGFIDPLTAVEAAVEYGVRVYTIGIGKKGMAPYPIQTPFGLRYQEVEVKIDEELLQDIAKRTGGKYFRATNNSALANIYDEIDQLEKARIQVTRINRASEEFYWFVLLAGIFLVAEWLLRYTVLRSIP